MEHLDSLNLHVSCVPPLDVDAITPAPVPDDAVQAPNVRHKKRVIYATRTCGYGHLATKIENCRKDRRCGLYWCPECRHASAKSLAGRLAAHFESRFGDDYAKAEKNLFFLTVLHRLIPLRHERVETALKEGKKLLYTIKRAFPGIWMQGAWELELMDMEALESCETGDGSLKRQTLGAMLPWGIVIHDPYMVLVHFHCVVDLGGEDPERFRKWLAKKKPWRKHHRQIRFDPIWPMEEQLSQLKEIPESLTPDEVALESLAWKLGSYPFKSRVQFNQTFSGKGFEGERFIPDRELAMLVQCHSSIGKEGLLIGIGGNSPVDRSKKSKLNWHSLYC